MVIDLRCPDCQRWSSGSYTPEEMREIDRACADGRRELASAYERHVADSMESLADLLARALALDLVGADDFRPRSVTLAR